MEKKQIIFDGEVAMLPPQSSVKLERRKGYYNWDIKIYCDDLTELLKKLDEVNNEMLKRYGEPKEVEIE